MAEFNTPKIVETITHVRTGPWAVNYVSDAFLNLNVELKAAPTRTNSATYLTHITIGIIKTDGPNPGAYLIDTKFTLHDGVGAEVFGPVQLQAQGNGVFSKDFKYPLKITDNRALDLSGAVEGGYYSSCFVYIEGFTGDAPIS